MLAWDRLLETRIDIAMDTFFRRHEEELLSKPWAAKTYWKGHPYRTAFRELRQRLESILEPYTGLVSLPQIIEGISVDIDHTSRKLVSQTGDLEALDEDGVTKGTIFTVTLRYPRTARRKYILTELISKLEILKDEAESEPSSP